MVPGGEALDGSGGSFWGVSPRRLECCPLRGLFPADDLPGSVIPVVVWNCGVGDPLVAFLGVTDIDATGLLGCSPRLLLPPKCRGGVTDDSPRRRAMTGLLAAALPASFAVARAVVP